MSATETRQARQDAGTRENRVATSQQGQRAATLHLQIRCRMFELRGDRTLNRMQALTTIHRGTLSQIERGERIPRPNQLDLLERGYGPRDRWYTVEVSAA